MKKKRGKVSENGTIVRFDNIGVQIIEVDIGDGEEDHTIRPLRESLRKLVGPDGRIGPSLAKKKKGPRK